MTLSAVIIILREVLEAAMVLSLLVSTTRLTGLSYRGILTGFVFGIAGAVTATLLVDMISDCCDGAGQELFNTVSLVAIVLLLFLYAAGFDRRSTGAEDGWLARLLYVVSGLAVALAIMREGTEIIIFMYGFAVDPAELLPILVGSAIGAGIGISLGVLIYYGIVNLPGRLAVNVSLVLLALLASGMAAQAVVYLMQGGLVESQLPVWDSSGWISETSVTGQLLYATLGYEATPTLKQLACYAASLGAFAMVVIITRWVRKAPAVRGVP
jgi:high-affinity iron transporter